MRGAAEPRLRIFSRLWSRLALRNKALAARRRAAPSPSDEAAATVRAARELIQAERHKEAWRLLRSVLATDPHNLDALTAVARMQHALGEAREERKTWSSVLALDPGHVAAHASLAKLQLQRGRPELAAPHLDFLAHDQPDDAKAWRRLAECLTHVPDPAGEETALQRLVELLPDDLKARRRITELALARGAVEDAVRELRALTRAHPTDLQSLTLLAECLGRLGDGTGEADVLMQVLAALDMGDDPRLRLASRIARRLTRLGDQNATNAWLRILQFSPGRADGLAQMEEIKLYGLGEDVGSLSTVNPPAVLKGARPRILVLGNCQAYGVSRQLRAMCPSAEVRVIGLTEARTPEDADALAHRWDRFDGVITQFVDKASYGDLVSEQMAKRTARLVYFPRLYFRGLQPDFLKSNQGLPQGELPVKGAHSAIIMAAHALGVPEAQVPDLFNAYIYGRLGYFEEFGKAELYHLQQARPLGIEFEPVLAQWRQQGAFLHLPNHPTVAAFQSLARSLAEQLGLPVENPDGDLFDELEEYGVWPVYPEIATRLGFQGSLQFRLGHDEHEPMALDAFVARSYRAYHPIAPELIGRGAGDALRILKAEGL